MSDFVIRSARVADTACIQHCIRLAYAEALSRIDDLPDVSEGIAEDIKTRGVCVAATETDILGVIVFDRVADVMMIFNLAVAPTAQGRGIAGRLLDVAERAAQEKALTRLRLRTHRQMQQAVRMYLHLGWTVTEQSGNGLTMERILPSHRV